MPLLIDPLFSSLGYVKGGKLKPLAVTNPARAAGAPNVPTVAEHLPGFSVQSVFGLVVPSGTPRAIVDKLNADVVKVLKAPDFRARLQEVGLEPVGNTPGEFDTFIRTEIDKWSKVVKASGAKLD